MIVEINSARTVSAPNVTATGTQETPSTVFAQEDKWQMDKKLKARYGFGERLCQNAMQKVVFMV